jgi:hypothetical protein
MNSFGRFRRTILRSAGERIVLALLMAVYAWCYSWLYIHWLSPVFQYMNFVYHPPSGGLLTWAWVLALLPCLWMPLSLTRPSVLFYWTLYIVAYVPSMFTPVFMGLMPAREVRNFLLTLAVSLLLTGLCYLFPLGSLHLRPAPPRLFWAGFAAVVAVSTVWILIAFHGQMRLVTLDYIYEVRSQAKAILASSLVGYVLLPMAMLLNPILMARGILRRSWLQYSVGAAGQVLILACTGLKSVPASVLAVLGTILLARYARRYFAITLAGFTAVCFVVFALLAYAYSGQSLTVDAILFSVVERTFGAPGMLSAQYQQFFSTHPLTYMSHVKGFNLLIQYPYQYQLGYEIGNFYVQQGVLLNQNAHMWVTDGFAAFGLPGMPLISCFATAVFWVVDWVSQHHDTVFVTAVLPFMAFQLTNMGIFTMLGSGGLALTIVVLTLMPPEAPAPAGMAKRAPGQAAELGGRPAE